MYKKGDFVRVEGTNELKEVIRVTQIENKFFYVCDDNLWYDEDLLYPAKMKLEIKESLGEQLTLSDFGNREDVMKELVEYLTDEENSEKLEEVINSFKDVEFDWDDW